MTDDVDYRQTVLDDSPVGDQTQPRSASADCCSKTGSFLHYTEDAIDMDRPKVVRVVAIVSVIPKYEEFI